MRKYKVKYYQMEKKMNQGSRGLRRQQPKLRILMLWQLPTDEEIPIGRLNQATNITLMVGRFAIHLCLPNMYVGGATEVTNGLKIDYDWHRAIIMPTLVAIHIKGCKQSFLTIYFDKGAKRKLIFVYRAFGHMTISN